MFNSKSGELEVQSISSQDVTICFGTPAKAELVKKKPEKDTGGVKKGTVEKGTSVVEKRKDAVDVYDDDSQDVGISEGELFGSPCSSIVEEGRSDAERVARNLRKRTSDASSDATLILSPKKKPRCGGI